MSFRPRRPDMPPPWPPFIPPFDPPGSEPPPLPLESDPPEGSSTDDSTSSSESRPDWWPDDWPWPPEPEEPVEILAPPPIHTWPRLPPDHPYHVPPGYSAPQKASRHGFTTIPKQGLLSQTVLFGEVCAGVSTVPSMLAEKTLIFSVCTGQFRVDAEYPHMEAEQSPTDHEAFLRLFTRFEGNLRAYVASLLPTREGVDDVMQESSVVLWRKFADFDQAECGPGGCVYSHLGGANFLLTPNDGELK